MFSSFWTCALLLICCAGIVGVQDALWVLVLVHRQRQGWTRRGSFLYSWELRECLKISSMGGGKDSSTFPGLQVPRCACMGHRLVCILHTCKRDCPYLQKPCKFPSAWSHGSSPGWSRYDLRCHESPWSRLKPRGNWTVARRTYNTSLSVAAVGPARPYS